VDVQDLLVVFLAEICHYPKDANVTEKTAVPTDLIIDGVDFKLERCAVPCFFLKLLK